MPTKKEIETLKEKEAKANTDMQLSDADFFDDADIGLQDVDKESIAIPFISILQPLSKRMEEVENAKAGLFINTVTNELYDKLIVAPLYFMRNYLAWVPRSEGIGFGGAWTVEAVEKGIIDGSVKREDNKLIFEKFELVDTRSHFVLVIPEGKGFPFPAVISMSMTNIKYSKRWIAQMKEFKMFSQAHQKYFTPPTFSRLYHLESKKEKNDKGTWYSFDVTPFANVTDKSLYDMAKELSKQFSSGEKKVDFANLDTSEDSENEQDGF